MKKTILVFLIMVVCAVGCFAQELNGLRNKQKFSGDFRFILDITSATSPNYYIDQSRVASGLKMAFYETLKQRVSTSTSFNSSDIVFVDNNQEFRDAIIVVKVTNIDVMKNSYFMAVSFSVTVGSKTISDIVSFSGTISKNNIPNGYNEAIDYSFTTLCKNFATSFIQTFFN